MQTGLLVTEHPPEASRGDAKAAAERVPDGLDGMMMDTLRQWIAPCETKREALRQRLDDAHFQRQPPIRDSIGERSRLVEQRCGTSRKGFDYLAQGRRGHASGERFDARSLRGQGVDWNIDTIEFAVVLGAVLQMVDHLQRGAERVIGGPNGLRLAVQVEHETADRRRRISAIVHELVPIGVTSLRDVAAEGLKKVERMPVRETSGLQHRMQRFALRAGAGIAAQS